MSRATDLPSPQPRPVPLDLSGKHVCPFCGAVNARHEGDASHAGPCPKCSMADTPATRKATKARIGPWFVRQSRNPAAPGMRFDTLLALVKRGQVSPQSVVRGPTTHQLWRFAAQVKGLSRAFGLCYSCGGSVESDATLCPHCNRMQEPPANPDLLLEGTLAPAGAGTSHEPVRKEIRPLDPRPLTSVPPAAPAPIPQAQHPADIFESHAAPLDDLDTAFDRRGDDVQQPTRSERQHDRREQRNPPPAPSRQRAAPSTDNAILSARDLAAAFQLDFKPTMRRPRKWFRKLLAALIFLALAAGAAVLVMNEELRRTSFAWTQQQYATIREAIVSRVQAPPIEDKAAVPVANTGRPSDITAPRDASRDVKPAPTTNAMIAASTMPAAPPAVAVAPSPPKIEVPRTPPPAPAPAAQPPPAPIDPAVAADQARVLWRQAIDAEARRDFAAAVDSYEQIKKLPKTVWPGGLEINLELARKRLQ